MHEKLYITLIGSDHALLMSTCRFETFDKKRVKRPNRKYDKTGA